MAMIQAEAAEAANPLVFGERRLHERKRCAFTVGVAGRNIHFRGMLRDLSLGGALVELPPEKMPKAGQEVVLTIPFRKKGGQVALRGTVARVRYHAVAITFSKSSN
ncbi:PilZ domain-containing protein [Desulfatitalea alkaliphila]|uniref:PilZ domain-containing protein n=1 Tax=Desulfatitalea alkaliphila TaxID=2929485 RepID=A0AA41R068_9BACT|nr:PilZ domain-containing protein [Desulfatitalea alkaliphila]MCJ8500402.1 PilZ domain-containing protein [Desulfatitalea alkaliphila]